MDNIWETIQYSNDNDNNKIDPYFGGLQENNIKCNKCKNISSKLESFTEIALSITNNKQDIKDENKEELCTKKMIDQRFELKY